MNLLIIIVRLCGRMEFQKLDVLQVLQLSIIAQCSLN